MQIIVYTGAILMLFLFVLMLVGVDITESLVETIKGQRTLAIVAGLGFGALLVFAVGNAIVGPNIGLRADNAEYGGNVQGIAALIFGRYVFAFEATSALLITAAVGAMVLAHQRAADKAKYSGRPGYGQDEALRRDRPASRDLSLLPESLRGTTRWIRRLCYPTEVSRSFRFRPRCALAARSWTVATLSNRSTGPLPPLLTRKPRAPPRTTNDGDCVSRARSIPIRHEWESRAK